MPLTYVVIRFLITAVKVGITTMPLHSFTRQVEEDSNLAASLSSLALAPGNVTPRNKLGPLRAQQLEQDVPLTKPDRAGP